MTDKYKNVDLTRAFNQLYFQILFVETYLKVHSLAFWTNAQLPN